MLKSSKISLVLFILVLASLDICNLLIIIIGKFLLVGFAGVWKYSWIAFLFIPLPLISLVFGLRSLSKLITYKKNIIVGAIVTPFLVLVACMGFMTKGMTKYDDYDIRGAAKYSGFDLPKDLECYEIIGIGEKEINALLKTSDSDQFLNFVSNSEKWVKESPQGKEYLPFDVKSKTSMFYDYKCYFYYSLEFDPVYKYNDDELPRRTYTLYYFAYSSSLNKIYANIGHQFKV